MTPHRPSRRAVIRLTTGAAVFAAGGWRAGSAAAQAEDIKVGGLYPLTGSLARLGADRKKAGARPVERVSAPHPESARRRRAATAGLPRLGGRRIRLIWADAKDPASARAEAERLIEQERVTALMGCYASAFTNTASLA